MRFARHCSIKKEEEVQNKTHPPKMSWGSGDYLNVLSGSSTLLMFMSVVIVGKMWRFSLSRFAAWIGCHALSHLSTWTCLCSWQFRWKHNVHDIPMNLLYLSWIVQEGCCNKAHTQSTKERSREIFIDFNTKRHCCFFFGNIRGSTKWYCSRSCIQCDITAKLQRLHQKLLYNTELHVNLR